MSSKYYNYGKLHVITKHKLLGIKIPLTFPCANDYQLCKYEFYNGKIITGRFVHTKFDTVFD